MAGPCNRIRTHTLFAFVALLTSAAAASAAIATPLALTLGGAPITVERDGKMGRISARVDGGSVVVADRLSTLLNS